MASTLITCANAAARPAAVDGDTVFQEDTKQILTYYNSAWHVYDSDGTGGYDLDGTNVLYASPIFHFDAGFINGVDATGNPSNAGSLTGQWTSKIGGKTTIAQASGTAQPTYYTSGENSQPYLSFDGGDYLNLTKREYVGPDLTIMVVAQAVGNNNHFHPIGAQGADVSNLNHTFEVGTAAIFYGYSNDNVLLYYADTNQGYVNSLHATGKDYDSETRSVIYRRNSSGGDSYIDGNNPGQTSTGASNYDTRFGSIGRGHLYMEGHIYEIILFDSYLDDIDLNRWGSYVTTKYAAGTGAMESQTSF